ncbi:MAG: chalcone isomerase family protein [Desulfobacteraceae bacterium]|nr:chalcone isomerase family protein [Desulfobacteraceae bacterium]
MLKKAVLPVCVLLLSVSPSSARTIEGLEIPETIAVGDETLALNGAGLREIIGEKHYVAGLYLGKPRRGPDAVIEADDPMVLRLEMISSSKADTMKRIFLHGFKRATGNKLEPIQERVEQFLNCFSENIKEGDIFEFKYRPGEGTEIYRSDKHLAIVKGFDFKKALFSIWLSKSSVDKGLQQDLLSGEFRVDIEDIN